MSEKLDQCRCTVPGHGTRCVIALETRRDQRREHSRERRVRRRVRDAKLILEQLSDEITFYANGRGSKR